MTSVLRLWSYTSQRFKNNSSVFTEYFRNTLPTDAKISLKIGIYFKCLFKHQYCQHVSEAVLSFQPLSLTIWEIILIRDYSERLLARLTSQNLSKLYILVWPRTFRLTRMEFITNQLAKWTCISVYYGRYCSIHAIKHKNLKHEHSRGDRSENRTHDH